MNYERKKIQHEILRHLENRWIKFYDKDKVHGEIPNFPMGIDELSELSGSPIETVRICCFELDVRGLASFSKNHKVDSFVIVDNGLTAFYSSLLLSEYDDLKLQAEVSNSVIKTNTHQRIVLWLTVTVTIITAIILYLQFELQKKQTKIQEQSIQNQSQIIPNNMTNHDSLYSKSQSVKR